MRYILMNHIERTFVSNNMIVKTSLPREIVVNCMNIM